MATLLPVHTSPAPSGPHHPARHTLAGDDPNRVGAFLFDLDSLFDADSFETARARATARAASDGVSPWLEVLAVEIAATDGPAKATEIISKLTKQNGQARIPTEILEGLSPAEDLDEVLNILHRRFKLGVVSNRSRRDTMQILRSLRLLDFLEAVAVVDDEGNEDEACTDARLTLEEPAECCVLVAPVGSANHRAAKAAGMSVVGLATSGSVQAGPDLVIDSFRMVEAVAAGAAAKYEEDDRQDQLT